MKVPVIDLGECVYCEACLELCPSVFRRNDAGYIEVVDLEKYPEEEVGEAIKNCPADCIACWEVS
ncbi:MAG: ferredoxin [Deltaproteobacteria bacterium]|nr:ferredoxin [Deltaproteobacteria bacterium]